MLESVKRKEREAAIAAVKKEVLSEKDYVLRYGYGSELLSMENQKNEPEGADQDMAIYGAKYDAGSVNTVNRNERVDPLFENHDSTSELLTGSTSSAYANVLNVSRNGSMKQAVNSDAQKLDIEARRLEKLKQKRMQQLQEEEEFQRRLQKEDEQRKKEIYEEQAAVLTGRKTKLSFSLGKKKTF